MKYKRLKVPIYNQVLHILICDDVEKEISEIRKVFPFDETDFNFAGFADYSSNGHYLFLLNKVNIKSKHFEYGVIAHESFHITNFIFKRLGLKSDVNNDEAQAYLLTWIVEQICKQNAS